jgi:rubrerythrin
MKETFLAFAKEEEGHKARITKVKESGEYTLEEKKVLDLKLGDYLVPAKTSEKMTYQEALILAMKREKAAYKLYMKLSEIAPNDTLKNLFKGLANEEAKHKLRFEIEYDDIIYAEN